MQPKRYAYVISYSMMDLDKQRILVQRSQQDVNAFGELYDEYYPKILNYALRRTASIQVAREVTSAVFFKALENIDRFTWRDIPFSAWLYRIATSEIANYYRGNGHRQHSLGEISEFSIGASESVESGILAAEAELQRHEEYLVLHRNIARLPLRYQETITLRFFEDKRITEISEILGKPEGTVKSLLHRGLEKLRRMMAEDATL